MLAISSNILISGSSPNLSMNIWSLRSMFYSKGACGERELMKLKTFFYFWIFMLSKICLSWSSSDSDPELPSYRLRYRVSYLSFSFSFLISFCFLSRWISSSSYKTFILSLSPLWNPSNKIARNRFSRT
jgi:hypothetical protein